MDGKRNISGVSAKELQIRAWWSRSGRSVFPELRGGQIGRYTMKKTMFPVVLCLMAILNGCGDPGMEG
ncbi:MAG: hypothetical protein Q4C47_09820, partial [Planctomycetia bacterium]|nr:hypothetical protein [Planctomycetia bacterium]